jgi:hypothetical protein
MPIIRTIKYEMTPLPVKVKLWNSNEMARAMGIQSGEKLIEMIERGGSGVSYHFREPIWTDSVNSEQGRRIVGYEYYFQPESYRANMKLAKWKQKRRRKSEARRDDSAALASVEGSERKGK